MSKNTKRSTLPLAIVSGLWLAIAAAEDSLSLRKDFYAVKIKKRTTGANIAQTTQEESAFG